MELYFAILLLVMSAVDRSSAAVEMGAKINMAGISGMVDVDQIGDATSVDMTGDIINYGYDVGELWSLPAVFGRTKTAAEVCSSGIGVKETNLFGAGLADPLPGVGEVNFYHRAILLKSSTNTSLPHVCGTILPRTASNTVDSYRAKFMGPVVGTVWLRYLATVGTFVYGDLIKADSAAVSNTSTEMDLKMFSGGSLGSSFSNRCDGLSGDTLVAKVNVFNSALADGTFGTLVPAVTTFGKYIGIVSGGATVACAELRQVRSKTATAVMNGEGVKGTFKFEQESPFVEAMTQVHLEGLQGRTSGYHIHKFPVPQRLSESENPCDGAFVSGHFNPYGVDVSKSPAPDAGTDDQYEIGDLSGKYGTLAGMSEVQDLSYSDGNLPLWGPNSIIGRSVVVHNSDGSRLMCGTIGYPSEVVTGVAVFKSPAYGTMYFRQDKSNPDEDTSIFVELASQTKTATSAHNWHVHDNPADDNAYTATDRCLSAGGPYNPSNVIADDPPYTTECGPDDPLRCRLGDFSSRLGTINVAATMRTEAGKFFFTDEYTHLSGQYSILGRSVVVHGPSQAAARFACANITQLQPIVATTSSSWVGKAGDAAGTVTFKQETEFDPTMVTGTFTGLSSLASGYHIHEYTISSTAAAESECEAASVGGHYNPFGWTAAVTPVNDTYDRYEVGDLSNKYGLLDSATQYNIPDNIMDTNLPLFTFLASTDKSIVIHKKEGGSRWKCANMYTQVPEGSSGYAISATVSFSTNVTGTIKLRQIVYEDGGAGLTSLELNVSPKSGGTQTLQHNWHIHINAILTEDACSAALGHFDPYGAADNTDYATDCTQTNPLFCEVGDLSKKQGRYDIGGGRKVYHDVDVPLHTNYTVLGRSIVFHIENGGANRYTCANIVPDDYTYTLAFPKETLFTRYSFTKTIADALGIARLRVVILHNNDVPLFNASCAKVMVHIAGGGSVSSTKLDQLVDGTLPNLGGFASNKDCSSEVGAKVLGMDSGSMPQHGSGLLAILAFTVTSLLMKW